MSALSTCNAQNKSGYQNFGSPKMLTNFLSPDLRPTLEKLILSSKHSGDAQKALEMLSSIDTLEKQRVMEYKLKKNFQRSKSANPKYYNRSCLQRFSTSYNEYYPVRELKETIATRPCSTENIIVRPDKPEYSNNGANSRIGTHSIESRKCLTDYDQDTTYNKDFCCTDNTEDARLNPRKPNSSTRAATASGYRCHNPHPSQAFLVWRYPRDPQNKASQVPSETALKSDMDNKFAHITDEQFNRVMRGNCRSTYQSDFVGGCYGDSRLTPFYIHPPIKSAQKLKISTQRVDYDSPQTLPQELCVPHDRYKSNRTKNQSARGIIPEAVNNIYMHSHARTTYDEDINDRAEIIHGEIVADIQRKVDFSRLHNMKALEKAMLSNTSVEDKETLDRIFHKLNESDDFKRHSYVRKPFYNTGKPCWTSNWPGPL